MKEDILENLVDHGYKINEYRLIMIDHILEMKTIDDIIEFWLLLRQECSISYTTLYANLRILVHVGVLIKSHLDADPRKHTYVLCHNYAN